MGDLTQKQVIEDYMTSGYWFVVCNTLNEAWLYCNSDEMVEEYAEFVI